MMTPLALQLFIYLSQIVNLPTPLLLMNEEEDLPLHICGGISFPTICSHYSSSDGKRIAHQIQTQAIRNNIIFLSDWEHLELIMELRNQPLLFASNHVWVMPLQYVSILAVRLDSIIISYERAPSGDFIVYESYAIKGGRPITTELFKWSPDEKRISNITMQMNLIQKRTDLRGCAIDISWHGKNMNSIGRNADILYELQQQLNFTINYVPSADKLWGGKKKNGTWNGLVGMLNDKKIDMTLGKMFSSMMITPERASVVEFLWSDSSSIISLMATKSTKPRLDAWGYIHVFSTKIWLLVFSFLMIAILCYSFASNEFISQGIALMLRLSLQMPYKVSAMNLSSKILMVVAAICLRMVFIYYTCTLKALMTSETQQINIRSYQDVIDQGFKVVTPPFGTKFYDILANAPDGSAMKQIYKSKLHTVMDSGCKDLAGMNTNFDTLCIGAPVYGTPLNLQFLDIVEATPVYKAIALQKDSEFTTTLNYQMLMMFESGKLQKINHKWAAKYDMKYGMEEPVQLGYENVLFPYNFLALGIALALPMILCEFIFKGKRPLIDVNGQTRSSSDVINVNMLLEQEIERLRIENAKLESRIKVFLGKRRTLL